MKTEKTETKIYLSSRGWGDFSPVEWRGDIAADNMSILAECKKLLSDGRDVDEPNQSDEEILKKIEAAGLKFAPPGPARTEPKEIFGAGYCYSCESYCYGDCGNYRPKNSGRILAQKFAEDIREQTFGQGDY